MELVGVLGRPVPVAKPSHSRLDASKQRVRTHHTKTLSELRSEHGMGVSSAPHVKARTTPSDYPQRFEVSDANVPWTVQFPGYHPVEFTHSVVEAAAVPGGWAEGPKPDRAQIQGRGSHELQARQQQWAYDAQGRPLNPRGRTGMSGRGKLGKWGPNHAGDAIVTRYHRCAPATDKGETQLKLEMVAIKRKDTGEWAIPGGMTDPTEVGKQALVREFLEEAGAVSEEDRARFNAMIQEVFLDANGQVVYRGYVDDPRNTDHAWMETIAMHFHCPEALGSMLKLQAGDDAAGVKWLEIGDHNPEYLALYASHKTFVDMLLDKPTQDAPAPATTRLSYAFAPPEMRMSTTSVRLTAVTSPAGSEGTVCMALSVALPLRHLQWSTSALLALPLGSDDTDLSVQDLLDIFSICPAELRSACKSIRSLKMDSDISNTTSLLTSVLFGEGTHADKAGNVFENLMILRPSHQIGSSLSAILELIEAQAASWTYQDDGYADKPPVLPDDVEHAHARIEPATLDDLRVLAFIDLPPALLDPFEIHRLRSEVFHASRCAFRPTAVVMVGPPGSGKSAVMNQGVDTLRIKHGGPPVDHYAHINPDHWITRLCDNNNDWRNVANYLNHESFLTAVAQRRHIIFDGTGKSVLNTCGKIISRLRQAGYCIHLCVVLATFTVRAGTRRVHGHPHVSSYVYAHRMSHQWYIYLICICPHAHMPRLLIPHMDLYRHAGGASCRGRWPRGIWSMASGWKGVAYRRRSPSERV